MKSVGAEPAFHAQVGTDGLRGPERRGPGRRGGIAATAPGKIGMWVFLATDAMGFGGLLFGYAVLRVRAATWPDPAVRFDRVLAGALTFVLLGSGATMSAALGAVRRRQHRSGAILLLVTAALGAAFALGQAAEFRALVVDRHVRLATDHAAALFFVVAGYHGLHVVVGVLVLSGIWIGAARQARSLPPGTASRDEPGTLSIATVEIAGLYWQFVDLVWIVIFTVVYLIPPVSIG